MKCPYSNYECECESPDTITITIVKPPGGAFKVGDRVHYIQSGLDGYVSEMDDSSHYPLKVLYDNGNIGYFQFVDGRNGPVGYPFLSFISRPKAKVKKVVERWINVYPTDSSPRMIHETEAQANKYADSDRLACVHLIGEYEVEE